MLTLHQFVPNPRRPDPSAFCSKVELFLKIHNLPYQGKKGNSTKAPKGKLPVLLDGSEAVADSDVIIRHLCKKHHIDPEAGLSPEQKALSFMIRKTMEEHYYFIMLHTRWIDPRGWEIVKPLFFSELPTPIKWIVPAIIRRQVKSGLKAQGIGRHEEAEIEHRGREVLEHLKPFFGKSDYLFGSEPSLVDCTVFPYLWGALHFPSESELKRVTKGYKPFEEYVERILNRYYTKEKS